MPYHVYITVAAEDKIAIWALHPDTGALTWQEDVVLHVDEGRWPDRRAQ